GRLCFFSKSTNRAHLVASLFTEGAWAGIGVDDKWNLLEAFDLFPRGFIQGNFDQNLLLVNANELKLHLRKFLDPLLENDRAGWICGLGHGVLPNTPEENVRLFVKTVREVMK